jgi:hypothetical protein
MTTPMISPTYLDRAHHYLMDVSTWDFAYDRWDVTALEETLFWYAASGQTTSHESTSERWWSEIRRGRVDEIKSVARERWADIRRIAPRLRALDAEEAFGWFLNGRSRQAWDLLQEIKYVGPKIASWMLRDLSFLRDYATDTGALRVKTGYPERNRHTAWFWNLPIEEQALFLPLDRWVIRGAHEYAIIPASMTIERIQGNLDCYVDAATTMASWARGRNLEPRDLDVYFYLTGIESLRRDGISPVAEGDDVWWCYDGGDCLDPDQDWLAGKAVKCAPTEVTVRVEGQLCDPETGALIAEQYIPIPLDRVRPELVTDADGAAREINPLARTSGAVSPRA